MANSIKTLRQVISSIRYKPGYQFKIEHRIDMDAIELTIMSPSMLHPKTGYNEIMYNKITFDRHILKEPKDVVSSIEYGLKQMEDEYYRLWLEHGRNLLEYGSYPLPTTAKIEVDNPKKIEDNKSLFKKDEVNEQN